MYIGVCKYTKEAVTEIHTNAHHANMNTCTLRGTMRGTCIHVYLNIYTYIGGGRRNAYKCTPNMNTYIMREPVFMHIWICIYIWGSQINTCKSTHNIHVCVYVCVKTSATACVRLCVCVCVCHGVKGWLHALMCSSDFQKQDRGVVKMTYIHMHSCVNA